MTDVCIFLSTIEEASIVGCDDAIIGGFLFNVLLAVFTVVEEELETDELKMGDFGFEFDRRRRLFLLCGGGGGDGDREVERGL